MPFVQVIPIYGRGGDDTDPREKAQPPGAPKEEDKDSPVPRRPAGQRLAPVQVRLTSNLQVILLPYPAAAWGSRTGMLARALNVPCAVRQRGGLSPHGNSNLQPGLGIIPTLFGMQQAPGMPVTPL